MATPIGTKTKIFTDIIEWGYRNAVIFEKPLTLTVEHLEILQGIAKKYKVKYAVAYNRRFANLCFPDKEEFYNISFPMVPRENSLIHNLPHALDLLMMLCNSINLTIASARKNNDEYEFMVDVIKLCSNYFCLMITKRNQK